MTESQKDKLIAALRKELLRFVHENTLESLERRAVGTARGRFLVPGIARCRACEARLQSASTTVGGCCSRECYTNSAEALDKRLSPA